MHITRQDVQFKTIDGLTLRGWLYPTPTRGPGIVITPGFNCVKEMFVPQVAEEFQKHGITSLLYDPRSLGESDGTPRNDIDPLKQISDYSDALTFLQAQPTVDPSAVAFWGMSFSGCLALCAAALDKRVRCCIAICPLLNFELTPETFPRVLAKSMQDRASQTRGCNAPLYLPVLTSDGKNPAGMGIGADREEFDYMVNAKRLGAPNHQNHTTMQSYYKIIAWQPHGVMRYMHSTPVCMVVPELDMISPPEEQFRLFETFPGPKKVHVASGKGHLNVLSGDNFAELCAVQVKFLRGTISEEDMSSGALP